MKNFFANLFSKKVPTITKRTYDAAQTTRHTANHFSTADNRDADSLISASLETLRNRARYEIRNNSYAKGITETKANDIVGDGPRLQMKTPNATFNRSVEQRFTEWMGKCDISGRLCFAEILRLAGSFQQDDSGESFIVMGFPEQAIRTEPALRLLMVESDRVNTPFNLSGVGQISADGLIRYGIKVDKYGKPVEYYIQKKHPGAQYASYGFKLGDYNTVPAAQVIHLFRQERPGQTRGVPWITPAIPLFAQLRRFTLATLDAAETAANYSGVIESDAAKLGEDADDLEALETIDIERNSLMTLPAGWTMSQFKAEHPTATYPEFKAEILNEIARCLNMPYNVAAANSAKYNYASGRLDWQIYFRSIRVIRGWIATHVCNRILAAWLAEARLIPGYIQGDLAPGVLKIDESMVAWYWPGTEHVDPKKEADAQTARLKNLTTTLAIEYARQGLDWELQLEQIAREQKKKDELGIKPALENKGPNNEPEKSEDDEEDEGKEKKENAGRSVRIA